MSASTVGWMVDIVGLFDGNCVGVRVRTGEIVGVLVGAREGVSVVGFFVGLLENGF